MATPLRLLFLEDNPSHAALVLHALRDAGYDPVADLVETEQEYRDHLLASPEIILADFTLPDFDALRALEIMRECRLDIPFIVVSGTIGEERAVELMRAGAGDYVLKDSLARLAPVVARELREGVNRRAHRLAEQTATWLAAIVESSDDAIISKTLDGVVTAFNAGSERLYGYRAAEVVGRSIDPLFPTNGMSELQSALDWVDSGERVEPFESVRHRRDGTRVDVSVSVFPVRDVEGRVFGVSSIARDITATKRAESALRASEERYRTLIAATTAIVWNTPASGAFETEQPGWTAFTGQTFDQLRGWGWLNAVHPEDREDTNRAWTAALAERAVYLVEHRLRRADGAYRQMAVRAVPVLALGGAIREWIGVHADVTDQRGAQAERDRLLTRLELQIERIPLAYMLTGPDLHFTRWNPAAERMFGFAEAEVLGKHPFEVIVPPQSRPPVGDMFERLKAGDMNAHGVSENVTRDGRPVICQWYNTPLMDAAGNFVGLLSLAQDITERRLLEDQLRQSQKMEAVGQLAGGVAHDFNNLLQVIMGYGELLLGALRPDDPSRELVGEITHAGERAAALTRQLLAFSRRSVVAPKVLVLNSVVIGLEKMLRRVIGEDIDLRTNLQPGLGCVRADPGQIEQIVMNLAVNARDAMPQGGKLTIETRDAELDEEYARLHAGARPGPCVLLAVSDTGHGMTPEVRARVFEPFFTTKEMGKGTGLGLATVFGIVQQAGGHVAVYSEPGVGTAFKAYLPRVEESASSAESRSGAQAPPKGTETVLLVEDEDAVRSLTRIVLQGAGYHVLEASDGGEALAVAGRYEGTIHLLLTDVVMPVLGGRQLAERLLALHPEMKVLFQSGYMDDAVVRHGVLQEKVHFLQKPFTPAALALKVREVLDAPR